MGELELSEGFRGVEILALDEVLLEHDETLHALLALNEQPFVALINVPTALKSRVHCALDDDGGSFEDEPVGLLQLSRQLLLGHAGV